MTVNVKIDRVIPNWLLSVRKGYVITVVDKAENYLQMVKHQFGHQTVPVVLNCDSRGKMDLIGGYTELEAHLNKSRKK